MAIDDFQSHCLEIIEDLHKTHQSVIITKKNIPIAKLEPLEKSKNSIIGIMKGKAKITGDIIDL
ncbi:type II toxin-antitoxin system Phd/YefM family antitoxin [Rickettsia endosymbiont of Rhinocyllus conicus]|uniref:type II toxin-antitoxin system Phd/YefM family antitoxin n=1 Tax=Rickettsia endosymbiont of Rhinocyllus conicus TaxID=3066252 RepID=UPI003132D96B